MKFIVITITVTMMAALIITALIHPTIHSLKCISTVPLLVLHCPLSAMASSSSELPLVPADWPVLLSAEEHDAGDYTFLLDHPPSPHDTEGLR